MQIFYAPEVKGSGCVLDPIESGHCVRVLRMKKGSSVTLVDGKGNLYEGFISDPNPHGCEITITETKKDFEKRDYRLHIAISPLKNYDRFEWFVEKSVEIGIDEITPILCRNTEKPGIKADRINNIIISAMKQSVKAFRPVLNQMVTFEEFQDLDLPGNRMIAHCRKSERSRIDRVYRKGEDAVILIGPEGDFTEEEVARAVNNGYKPVHLGMSRLRTETAGICACHSIYFINQ
ncbi:MAG: 16S rRNA (uracil(1498)-N(3))-methyltransferase [Bacteroidales bacterium]